MDIIGPVVGSATPAGESDPELDCGDGDEGRRVSDQLSHGLTDAIVTAIPASFSIFRSTSTIVTLWNYAELK